ncbi:MAG TPA: sn-glycerol-1-phosphate dehydrogenase [Candidatus Angelobacter sp.]|nr:sn-glycerol-1-phosphate dehydrogenase [Candidatus Angelobacter sp.]
MSKDMIDQLIAGSLPDPDGGSVLRVVTRSVVIAPSLQGSEADIVAPLELGRHLAVVSDSTTHELLGARVERALASLGRVTSIVLPGRPHPDAATVERIRAESATADAFVAVGSGTINDLCKYASARDGKRYVVFATAPSMNGYTSLNAAITVDGLKKSLAAQAPLGVFLDLAILAAAPARMIRSGLGDSLCRPTAQADWLLSHLLFDRPYRTMPFVLLAADETQLFAEPEALMAGDLAAMTCLVRTLLLSGFGTAICGNSQPASQGEHLISHFADMFGDHSWPDSFHGEQIGVTTLTMARLQERLLAGPPPALQASAADEAVFVARYGEDLGRSCWAEFAQKRLDAAGARAVNERIAASWGRIRQAIARVTHPALFLADVLRRAGAPTAPEALGWPREFYHRAVRHARDIRGRYTFLDLAADSESLEPVNELG